MPSDQPNRRLAAILFADIVGYTSMMQSDEGHTMSRLKHYQKVLQKNIKKYNGEIIKNYGDGSLCLFSSVLDAVHCSKVIQETLRQVPHVPLRIGLHLGDVMYRENDVYGNDINIASRIESLGTAGSVLMSGDFLNKIKNQTEFKFHSLGKYHFKNVEEKMEVIALANEGFLIPTKSDMVGKLKKSSSPYRWVYILTALILTALITNRFINFDATHLTDEQKNKSVTILDFENKTGLNNLEHFGTMISDWLTSRLMETGEAKVISQANIKDQIQHAGIGPGSRIKMFSETGIGLVILGRYYLQNDELVIQPNIVDTETGEVIHAPSPIIGSQSNMKDLLEDFTQEILGYWQIRNQKRFLQKPPRYDAYLEYLKGMDFFNEDGNNAEEHFKKAYQLDTTFISPLLKLIPYYHNKRRYNAQDSLYIFLDKIKPNYTRWELLVYEFMRARDDGKWLESADLANQASKMDPSHYTSFTRAANAYIAANHPQKIIDMAERIDPLLIQLNDQYQFSAYVGHAMLLQQDYAAVVLKYEKLSATRSLHPWETFHYIEALIYSHEADKISSLIKDLPVSGRGLWLYRICNSLLLVNENTLSEEYANQLKEFALENNMSPKFLLLSASAEMYLKNWNAAIMHFERHLSEIGPENITDYTFIGDLSMCYAQVGDMSKSYEILEKALRGESFEDIRKYHKSKLLVVEGKLEEAIDSLSISIQLGYGFETFRYQFDHNLKPLFENERFLDLVKVKD